MHVTDQTPKGPGAPSSGRSSSLVERAANRIVADGSPQSSSHPWPAPAQPAPPPEDLQSARGRPLAGDSPPAQGVGARRPDAIASSDSAVGDAIGAKRRRSNQVKIDVAGLASRNILTPKSKRSRIVEEFRLIKRKLVGRRWSHGDGTGNTIIVTSALPQEGKTTVAVNLAMSIAAEEDLRVLLIDADFIRPNALRQLGVSAEKGLIDVLEDSRLDIGDVMLATDVEGLSLIPSGRLHDRCTELLASTRMSELINEMATRYEDRILIFDSPPVLATTESVTLASHMSRIVFVIQAERTRRELVTSALELLGNAQPMGIVLNRAKPGLGSSEFGSYYGAYYYHTPDGEAEAARNVMTKESG
jgi:receptor protein-tyrosine kinase